MLLIVKAMRILNRKRLLHLLLLLLIVFVCGFAACEVDTKVSITDSKNPPTFSLTGTGTLMDFIVAGPYSSREEMASGKPDVIAIWKISPGEDRHKIISDLPHITYGYLPQGFRQETPASGAPLPLEEGKFYSIGTPSINANFRRFCFKVEQNAVIKVECRKGN